MHYKSKIARYQPHYHAIITRTKLNIGYDHQCDMIGPFHYGLLEIQSHIASLRPFVKYSTWLSLRNTPAEAALGPRTWDQCITWCAVAVYFQALICTKLFFAMTKDTLFDTLKFRLPVAYNFFHIYLTILPLGLLSLFTSF